MIMPRLSLRSWATILAVALLVAGYDKLWSTGGGTLIWLLLLAASVVAIWRIWTEANTY